MAARRAPRGEESALATYLHLSAHAIPELIGTFLFTFFGTASSAPSSGVGLGGALGNGLALTSVLWLLSNRDGSGKLNCAAASMVWLTGGYTGPTGGVATFFIESSMQVAGAIIAGLVLKHLLPNTEGTCFAPTCSNTATFVWEYLGTFLLLGVIEGSRSFGAIKVFEEETSPDASYKRLGSREKTTLVKFRDAQPLAIGLALFSAAQAAGPYTGGCFNPARYLANVGLGCSVDKYSYYIGAQFAAAASYALVIIYQRFETHQRDTLGLERTGPGLKTSTIYE